MDLQDVLVFTRVAQAGSFSRAAKRLQMPVSTVSRRVAALEASLGVPLLVRTTRSLKLTDVGKVYLEHGQTIADELERAEAFATNLHSVPQGTLRLTTTPDFGNHFLGKILHEFLAEHPRVRVDVVLTERVVDLIEEGFDLGIRMGELESSSLVARKIGSLHLHLYASPAFLKARGEPKTPSELSKRDCVLFTGEESPGAWRLEGPRGKANVEVSGRIASNHMAMVKEAVLAGEGIGLMPHFLCTDDVNAGRLKLVLKDWGSSVGPIHVVYPGQRYVLPRVRAFVEHIARSCAAMPWRPRSSAASAG